MLPNCAAHDTHAAITTMKSMTYKIAETIYNHINTFPNVFFGYFTRTKTINTKAANETNGYNAVTTDPNSSAI